MGCCIKPTGRKRKKAGAGGENPEFSETYLGFPRGPEVSHQLAGKSKIKALKVIRQNKETKREILIANDREGERKHEVKSSGSKRGSNPPKTPLAKLEPEGKCKQKYVRRQRKNKVLRVLGGQPRQGTKQTMAVVSNSIEN